MTEKLLQFIWNFKYYNTKRLETTSGEAIQVLYGGRHNRDAGPDFLDARIKIGPTALAGSVELHLKTSDWYRHGHQHDAQYNNVVLHVVYQHDVEGDTHLPVLELQHYIPKLLLDRFERLMQETTFVPCGHGVAETKELQMAAWKERLVAERLTRKANYILNLLQNNNGHWEETFWQMVARNFGIKVNADAFEQIAQSLPITILARHKNSMHQLEALLLGQAQLLEGNFEDAYCLLLQREYHFLKTKYKLSPAAIRVQFLRMRPPNFPTVRLAQLAMLVQQSSHLFSKVIEADHINEVKAMLGVTANDYWHYHYRLEEPAAFAPKKLGAAMIDNIIINTVVPVLFAYGLYHQNEKAKVKALQWLEATPAEVNTITNGFKEIGVANISAFDSQALLELKNEYCNSRRCLECTVGNALLKRTATL